MKPLNSFIVQVEQGDTPLVIGTWIADHGGEVDLSLWADIIRPGDIFICNPVPTVGMYRVPTSVKIPVKRRNKCFRFFRYVFLRLKRMMFHAYV